MDQIIAPSANIQAVQWPLNLYPSLNPAEGWRKAIAPGNPLAGSAVAQQPDTIQNNQAMLTALNDRNWPLIQDTRTLEAHTVNEQALQVASQDRNFTEETMRLIELNRHYNQNGAIAALSEMLTWKISMLV